MSLSVFLNELEDLLKTSCETNRYMGELDGDEKNISFTHKKLCLIDYVGTDFNLNPEPCMDIQFIQLYIVSTSFTKNSTAKKANNDETLNLIAQITRLIRENEFVNAISVAPKNCKKFLDLTTEKGYVEAFVMQLQIKQIRKE